MRQPAETGSTQNLLARKRGRWIEHLLLTLGSALLAVFVGAYIHRAVMSRAAMRSFERAKQETASNLNEPDAHIAPRRVENRPATSRDGLSRPTGSVGKKTADGRREVTAVPLAILRIPGIHLEVPVLRGTDDITLNRGVGQIAGTAAPGEKGNIGLAGHRDSFFRNLKEIRRGDEIELETTKASEIYVVDRILVTGPEDVSVLRPRDAQSLTLVTCYPFRFVGPAPRRFVVGASLKR